MKILQIVHSFPSCNNAGTEIYTYHLSKELSKRHNIFVFYRLSDFKKREYELDYYQFNGLNIFTINNTFRFCDSFEKFYRNDTITREFVKVLDKIKPDIVHIQHLIFLSTTIISEIKKRGIPIVFTLHDYWLICPQWHFLKKDFTICDNNDISQCIDCLNNQLSIKRLSKAIYSIFRSSMPASLTRFLKNIYLNMSRTNLNSQEALKKIKSRIQHIREMCSMVDLFIAPSQFLRMRFIEFGIPDEKIKFIPHGINTELFKNFKRKESGKIRFGFIGTILPAKGVDILINAFNRIKDNQAELRFYGRLSSYQGFEYYPRLIKRLAKSKNIKFMGGFDHEDVAKVFSEIDILVLPSIWYENFPLTILEAFSTRTSIIASRIGGIPELIKDKENGLLFQPGDSYDLYDKMKTFVSHPDLVERFKTDVNRSRSIAENGRQIEQLYKDLLNGK